MVIDEGVDDGALIENLKFAHTSSAHRKKRKFTPLTQGQRQPVCFKKADAEPLQTICLHLPYISARHSALV